MTSGGDQLEELFDGRIDIDGDDLSSGRHDLTDRLFSEVDDGLDHLSFGVFENSFFLAGIDERLNFLLRGLVSSSFAGSVSSSQLWK